jgi:hypothetical protein
VQAARDAINCSVCNVTTRALDGTVNERVPVLYVVRISDASYAYHMTSPRKPHSGHTMTAPPSRTLLLEHRLGGSLLFFFFFLYNFAFCPEKLMITVLHGPSGSSRGDPKRSMGPWGSDSGVVKISHKLQSGVWRGNLWWVVTYSHRTFSDPKVGLVPSPSTLARARAAPA